MITTTQSSAHGRTIPDIAAEILRQRDAKQDYLVEGNNLRMFQLEEATPALRFSEFAYALGDIAHSQLAAILEIPANYYNRMKDEAPELLAVNVNHWLDEVGPQRKMIRTLDGKARAILSDRYKIVDHDAIFGEVMGYLNDAKATIRSSDITEKKLYIRAIFPVEGEVKRGQVVRAGVQITNSEVGMGAVSCQAWTEVLTCLNGAVMVSEQMTTRSLHLGGGYAMDGNDPRLFATDTIAADAKAISLKTRDIIRQCSDPKLFDAMLKQMREGSERMVEPVGVAGVVTVLPREIGLTKAEAVSSLNYFVQGGDLSQWGLANSVTRLAQDAKDFDRRVELETVGGKLINMTVKEFSSLSDQLVKAGSN